MVEEAGALQIARATVEILDGSAGCGAALATVIHRAGSAPQIEGARLLLRADGHMCGTVGGGAIEMKVLEACHETLRTGVPQRVKADLVRDLGMCCGGSMEVFVEYLAPSARLIVIGGGHVAQALVPVCRSRGFRVTVVDDREDILAHPSFAEVDRRAFDADELADALPDLDDRDFVVVVTRDHLLDERALAHLIERPHRFLGMIGSQRKVRRLLGRILRRYDERGHERPDLSRLHAPIGLALGGRTPAEIAVSIASEFVAMRHGGHGGTMSVIPAILSASPPATASGADEDELRAAAADD
jgi:xanthine dehydrogenase accessory factor